MFGDIGENQISIQRYLKIDWVLIAMGYRQGMACASGRFKFLLKHRFRTSFSSTSVDACAISFVGQSFYILFCNIKTILLMKLRVFKFHFADQIFEILRTPNM